MTCRSPSVFRRGWTRQCLPAAAPAVIDRFKSQLCQATERGDALEIPGNLVAPFRPWRSSAGEHLFGAAFFEHGKHRLVSSAIWRCVVTRAPAALLMAHRLREGVIDPSVPRVP